MQALVVLGGVGLFLVGMVILTEGLRAMAGDSIRRFLAHFTTTPAVGIATGAMTTAIIQSSSATTVATIGFVGAGLLTFPQALGIVLGANIGTTITGWLVALFGFKLQLSALVQPIVLAGVVLRLFGRGWLRHLGWALTGFALLFIAIDAMKIGMEPWQDTFTPDSLPGDKWSGRLQLVLLGMAITVITQSSSAGGAIALIALGTGSITLPQAAAMVIGMDVGTTFTAALATLGGSTTSRQTGYAHVIYNIMTGVMAFLLLDVFATIAEPLITAGTADEQIALVAFHTSFNTLGAVIALPFTAAFARLIRHLVPERGPHLLRRLDERFLRDPAVAVETVAATVRDIAFAISPIVGDLLDRGKTDTIGPSRLNDIDNALEGARHYLGKIRTDPAQAVPHRRHVATMHILDHLFRLSHRCKQQARIAVLRTDKQLRPFADQLKDVAASIEPKDLEVAEMELELDSLRSALLEQSHAIRAAMVEAASVAGASTEATIVKLDAIRWLHRVSYHYWRIAHHLLFLEPSPDGSIRRAQMPEIGTESNVISQSKNCTKYQS